MADSIELVAYDPAWPALFTQEAAALRAVLPPVDGLRIEHVGSTAVTGLRAKPIIDIVVMHPVREDWPRLVAPIASPGYIYWAENPRTHQMFFVKGMPPYGPRRTHHVHVRVPSDARREIAFRDLLRADAALARRYVRLKEALAERYASDREAYTDGKTAFIEEALGTARPDRN